MRRIITRPVRWVFRKLGYEIQATQEVRSSEGRLPRDFEEDEIEDYLRVAPYTMAGPERTVALMRAIRYLVDNQIPGDIVECGVWKGGSTMAACLALLRLNELNRQVWLYDTFSGMSKPTQVDISNSDHTARGDFQADYLKVGLEEVREAVLSTNYDPAKVSLIKGKVEDTIPAQMPDRIALLRLDTDWYESTRHELIHLFPRLVNRGVLIIDDYGHWQGARKATDEYLSEKRIPFLLGRVDFSCRMGVKV